MATNRTWATLILTLALAAGLSCAAKTREIPGGSPAQPRVRPIAARIVDGCREEPAPQPVETLGCR